MIRAKINAIDLFDSEYRAVLQSYDEGVPSAQISKVTIPGRNGELDMSRAITDDIAYSNRTVTARFVIRGDADIREKRTTAFINQFAGKDCTIEFSTVEGYYKGLCVLSGVQKDPTHFRNVVELSFDCYPFRIKEEKTIHLTLTGKDVDVLCDDVVFPVMPQIKCAANCSIRGGNKLFVLHEGTNTPALVISPNNNAFKVSGTGDFEMSYNVEVI